MRNRPVLEFSGNFTGVVVAIGVVVLLSACSTEGAPAAQTGPTESTPVEQTTSPTLTSQPADLDDHFGELVPGPYAITDVPPFNITITVPAGWEKLSLPSTIWTSNSAANLGFGTVDNLYADPCAIDLGMLDPPPGPSVDDLVAAFAALPGMETTTPQEVTVDGHAAKYIELSGPADPDDCVNGEALMWNTPSVGPVPAPSADGPGRLWIVDVAGNRLVIASRAREETSPEQYAEIEQMLESIQIESS